MVADKAVFPRDKVCAGWITPQVLHDLEIDPDEYREGRTFQPITGFRVGVIGEDNLVETSYGHCVSFGIRRCEFDDYLLRRSGARLLLGAPISSIRRDGPQWVVNNAVRAQMLVGAGGHFCPVARMLNGPLDCAPLVVAQEVELPIDRLSAKACRIIAERPELHFCPDLAGYGWCFRKGEYLNVGFGRLDRHALPKGTAEFVSTIVEAIGRYSRDRLEPYARHLQQRFGEGPLAHLLSRIGSRGVPTALALRLLDKSWFVRRVVLDRWFLHAREAALAPA